MATLTFNQITFTYSNSSVPIFKDCSLTLDTQWHCGLIGRNGRGKTTLLKLLMKELIYDGTIHCPLSCVYFPFKITQPERMTASILKEYNPMIEKWQWMKEFSFLELKEECFDRSYHTLSLGEQTKIMLIMLFFNERAFYLIDEPTNHLDSQSRMKVADYLSTKQGFILVSHDRSFLDRCVDHIVSINASSIDVQKGNYSQWKLNYDRKIQHEFAMNEQTKKDIIRLNYAKIQTATWSDKVEATKIGQGGVDRGYIGHKAAKMMKRSKSLEKRTNKSIESKTKLLLDIEKIEQLKLQSLPFFNHHQFMFRDVCVWFNKPLHSPVSFDIKRGDRLLIEGKNGSGKSSLIRCCYDSTMKYSGEIQISSQLVISYVSQDTSLVQGTMDQFIKLHQLEEPLFKAILRKLGINREQFDIELSLYSQGQKKKVLIAKSLCDQAHVYIWDEPLNYLDIHAREQVEQLIMMFEPTMIIIEHDTYFQSKICTKKISLD